jgi:hypothetical protein
MYKTVIENLENDELILLCDEAYTYHINGTGIIPEDSKLRAFFDAHDMMYRSMNDLVDDLLDESAKRYGNIVKALMLKRSYSFIART